MTANLIPISGISASYSSTSVPRIISPFRCIPRTLSIKPPFYTIVDLSKYCVISSMQTTLDLTIQVLTPAVNLNTPGNINNPTGLSWPSLLRLSSIVVELNRRPPAGTEGNATVKAELCRIWKAQEIFNTNWKMVCKSALSCFVDVFDVEILSTVVQSWSIFMLVGSDSEGSVHNLWGCAPTVDLCQFMYLVDSAFAKLKLPLSLRWHGGAVFFLLVFERNYQIDWFARSVALGLQEERGYRLLRIRYSMLVLSCKAG